MDVGPARRVATAASDGLAAAVLGRFRGLREALAGADGYAVVDSACGAPAWLAALREAAEALPSSLLRKNSTLVLRPGSDTPDVFAKRGIDEAEVSLDAEVQAASPVLAALATDTTTATALAAALPAERFAGGAQAIKLQVSRGGGACFPLHHDAADDGRELTVIHYVSERWEQGWGGELKLFPLGKPAVLVPPKPDRLVVFRSNSMLHRASGAKGAGRPHGIGEMLGSAPFRRHLSRVLFAGEWERSLLEAHGHREGTELVRNHVEQVSIIRRAARLDELEGEDALLMGELEAAAALEPVEAVPLALDALR
eukprot:PRCOL_00000602-RA